MSLEKQPRAEAAHSSGPFLLIGPLISPLGQPNSTLVAVSIFLLLSSLTYLLFKLSPRLVTKGCVWLCMSLCYCMCVYL